MSRSIIAAATLALLAVALPAAADEGRRGDQGTFPMPASEFSQRVEARLNRAHERLEARLAKKNPPAEKAAAMRQRFETNAATIRAEAQKAEADGTVTQEEADHVREVARSLHPHHHRDGDRGHSPAAT